MNDQMKKGIRPKVESYVKRAEEIKNILRSESVKRKGVGDVVNSRWNCTDKKSDGIAASDRRRLMPKFESL